MSSKVDLDKFIEAVGLEWPYNNNNYPGFAELDDRQKKRYIVGHATFHLMESVAKLASEAEHADHGALLNLQQVRIATARLLVNVLKLAHELHLSAEQLEDLAMVILRERH